MTNPSKVIIQTIPLRYKLATVKDMRYWILDEEGKFYKTLPFPLSESNTAFLNRIKIVNHTKFIEAQTKTPGE